VNTTPIISPVGATTISTPDVHRMIGALTRQLHDSLNGLD